MGGCEPSELGTRNQMIHLHEILSLVAEFHLVSTYEWVDDEESPPTTHNRNQGEFEHMENEAIKFGSSLNDVPEFPAINQERLK